MMPARTFPAALLALALAGPAAAQESGGFVVRLGQDTTSVEHFTRTPGRLEIDQIGRTPRVTRRQFAFEYGAKGAVTRATITITVPGAAAGAPPLQQIDARFTSDSVAMESRRDTVVQRVRAAVPAGAVVITNASPWSAYEAVTMRLAGQKADSLRLPLYYVGAPSTGQIVVRRLGADSVEITTDNDRYHALVDRAGRLMHVVPIRGTAQFSADRQATIDLGAYTASFLAREQQAGAMGMLSTRDTVRVSNAGGATLWIDYGRPARRGRTVFGVVVPWGEVWRTGANAATQFKTDKPLEMGGTVVPAGFYTLWTIPSPKGWKLVINSETGQWGTQHKAERDLYTLDMAVSTLPAPVERFTIGVVPDAQGGVLNLDWDTTRASIPFKVKS